MDDNWFFNETCDLNTEDIIRTRITEKSLAKEWELVLPSGVYEFSVREDNHPKNMPMNGWYQNTGFTAWYRRSYDWEPGHARDDGVKYRGAAGERRMN